MKIYGKAWKFGDNVNTDLIIAGKYKLSITDVDELSRHAMEAIMPDFAKKVEKGDILVAGKNFGCGSSREQAPLVLKHLGIGAVIAQSFARIFFRNAINIGLPAVEFRQVNEINEGDLLEIDLVRGSLRNVSSNKLYSIKPIPSELWQILSEGGLVSYVKKYGRLPWQQV
ncbi:MAG: 3-isopropylmalate dehydratase small subunit [Nitrososphaerota archaeon]|nr:3-isopropylmalate dehydratase small subunit [Candidatus Bathyarchaeota archaeon]MDW8048654.1 3-isopropylmalate dehydratase small subunit [Nitrososphaerota archaeon]